MAGTPTTSPDPQHILTLARSGKTAATAAIRGMRLEEQVALVCETPLARRSEMLALLPQPEDVIPLMPEAELCFTIKAIGIEDSSWLLEHATPDQIIACLDLDTWQGNLPDRDALDRWLDVLSIGSEDSFIRSVRALDPEVVVLFLKHRIECHQKPDDDEGWQPPIGGQTVDGQFYYVAIREKDDLVAITSMLRSLFTIDYWMYFRMMQGIIHEPDNENEEWALRWRTGRLEDLGFPPWDRAMLIYRFIRPEDRTLIPEETGALDVGEWHLPIWMPSLPATADHQYLLFRTLARLEEEERRSALYGFIALANKIAVADRMELGDAESTPRAIDKAAAFASDGLEFIARERNLDATEVIRRANIEHLFRVGANLNPERARPRERAEIDLSESEQPVSSTTSRPQGH